MPESSEPLLELIDKAQRLAEQERRPMVAYLLHMAADEAAHGKADQPHAVLAQPSKWRRRWRWRWSPKSAIEAQH